MLDKSNSCYSRVGEHQCCFAETSEGFSDVGAAAAWHKALIADFVPLRPGLNAISSMLVVQGRTELIPDVM